MEKESTKERILSRLGQLTGNTHIKLTNCGDAAIFLALYIAKRQGKRTVVIPDQGGWLSYKSLPLVLGLEIREVRTDLGIVDLSSLREILNSDSVLLVSSIAGYIAAQPLAKIGEICQEKQSLFVLDVAPSLGDTALCSADHADMMVGSFGRWKPVDLGYGGFISARDPVYLKQDPTLFKIFWFQETFEAKLLERLNAAEERVQQMYSRSQQVKSELLEYDVVHREGKGLVVVVRFFDERQRQQIVEYSTKNGYEFTLCPRYIRIMENAICIELKRD